MLAEQRIQREARQLRSVAMVDRLIAEGYPISHAQVAEIAGDSPVGRPHVAMALVASGVVPTVDAAFGGLLEDSAKFEVVKQSPDVLHMIALVRDAGGLPVFAHPFAWRRGPVVDEDAVRAMARAGLVGIEADHPDHDDEARAQAWRIARELDLVVTGASDHHGSNKSRNDLGVCTTNPESYEALLSLGSALEPVGG